jgi:hypothetical protein
MCANEINCPVKKFGGRVGSGWGEGESFHLKLFQLWDNSDGAVLFPSFPLLGGMKIRR